MYKGKFDQKKKRTSADVHDIVSQRNAVPREVDSFLQSEAPVAEVPVKKASAPAQPVKKAAVPEKPAKKGSSRGKAPEKGCTCSGGS